MEEIMDIPIYELFPNGTLNNIALVESPAIEELFLKFNKEEEPQVFKMADETKHIVCGPALIPNKKIIRYDMEGTPYFVFFSEKTVEELSQTFLRDGKNHAWNLQHEQDTNDVYITESWIVKDPETDKSKALGFTLPKGTWMVSAKVENPEIWKGVESGEFRGFSIDGLFKIEEDIPKEPNYDELLKSVVEIIKQCE